MKETLREYVDSRGVMMRVDRQAGIIHGVKILGLESRNGRRYPPETLARAMSLYEGAKVNVNHAGGGPVGPRDYRDRIGAIRNVRLQPAEGLFADFHFNPKHSLAEQLIWDAENAAENVGFSHNVRAKTARRGDRVEVEEITKVESVDLVADPATTQGLFESAADPAVEPLRSGEDSRGDNLGQNGAAQEAFIAGLSLETLRDKRPDLVENLLQESRSELESLRRELVELRESARRERRERLIGELLAEFELPRADEKNVFSQAVAGQRFVQSLREAPDEETVRSLVRERAELIGAVQRCLTAADVEPGKPLCRGQAGFSPPHEDANSFVKAIARRAIA